MKGQNGDSYPPHEITFTTGQRESRRPPTEISFSKTTVHSGDRIASLLFSNDFQYLYATTLTGSVFRWDVQGNGSLTNKKEIDLGNRCLIGIAIDPRNSNRLWVSNNSELTASNPPPFGGKISYNHITNTNTFEGRVTDYIQGLPRSSRDHFLNSINFGPGGDLFMNVGSNSAMGSPDPAWSNRPETLLSAAVLRLDTQRTPPSGGFDVKDGSYDPFASNAVLKIYATGLRNSYDNVFHSNGFLYIANNGSGAGGNSPDDPDTPVNESIQRGATQQDFLYRVEEGGYYGHPNPTRSEWIRDGGNPTQGVDVAEVTLYPVGTQPEPNYKGFAHDFGTSRSPNGSVEYKSQAFGGALDGYLLVCEYSRGDDIVGLKLDGSGNVVEKIVVATGFNNPLDLAVHSPSGRLYVQSLGSNTIDMLTPQ